MLIKKLVYKNFRVFEEQEFTLKQGINIFIGPNAVGKTSLLEGLSVALGSFLLGIRGYDSRHIRSEDIRVVAIHTGDTVNFEKQFPVEIHVNGIVMEKEISWGRTLNSPLGRTDSKEAKLIKKIAEDADKSIRQGDDVTLPLIVYYGNGRLWQEPRDTGKVDTRNQQDELSRFMGYYLCIDPRCSPRDLMRWIKRQEWIEYKSKTHSLLLTTVKKAIIQCLERVKSIGFDPEREEMTIQFNDDQELPFGLLSDGQRGISAMVGDMAMRAAKLNPHLGEDILKKTPGVVLIDEVDLYLHPKWQRNILRNLGNTFPNIQFVCTTHSPQVVGEVEPDRVFDLESQRRFIQSYGLDSNSVIKNMGGNSRTRKIEELLENVNNFIDQDNFIEAQKIIDEIQKAIHGSDEEISRLETIIRNIKALSD